MLRITVGRPWLPPRVNGLWLALGIWFLEEVYSGAGILSMKEGAYLPPDGARRAWQVLQRHRLDGTAWPVGRAP